MIRKLLKDSCSSAMVPVVKICITFVMAPVIVHALGNYDYGIWEIVFSIIAYMELLDFGLIPAIVRNVARFYAINDKEELHKIYSSSLAFFVPGGFLMATGLVLFSLWAPDVFVKSPDPQSLKYTWFFLIISMQVIFVFVGSVFDCFLEGLQLYSLRNIITILFSIIGSSVIYVLLKNGGGLLSLAIVNACGYSLKFILYGFLLSTRKFGGFIFNKQNISRKTLNALLSFGLKSFVWAISLRIATLTDPLIIGAVLGAAVVPFYMIPNNFISQARSLVWSVTRIYLPVFSGLDAKEEKDKSRKLYYNASRFMLGFILPLISGICILGPSFLSCWMGPEYAENGAMVLYIIAAAYLIQWLNPFSRRFLTAIDRHEILARVGIIGAMVNLGLSFVLVHYIGKEGVALATLLPILLVEPYLLYKTCQEMGCSIVQYSRNVFLPVLLPSILFIVSLKIIMIFIPTKSVGNIALIAILGLGIYIPFFIIIAMKQKERETIYFQFRSKLFPAKPEF